MAPNPQSTPPPAIADTTESAAIADPSVSAESPVIADSPGTAESSVIVENFGTARIGTRIVDPVLRTTLQQVLRAAAWVGNQGPREAEFVFLAGRYSEAPARIIGGTPRGIRRRPVRFEHCEAEWLWDARLPDPSAEHDAAILYFHGGAFVAGGLNSYRRYTARMARTSALPVLTVDYRQLPYNHIRDSLHDGLEAYRSLLDAGFPAGRLILAGDSAGGGLALRLALAARDLGMPLPAGISVTSPWADFDSTARLAHPNARHDAVLPTAGPDMVVRRGIAIDGKVDPRWSVVNHDFTGLPPILVQVGSEEMLLSDALEIAKRCEEAHVPLRLQIRSRTPHSMIYLGAGLLGDGRAAMADAAAFHRGVLDTPAGGTRVA
ncbi:alpha/beta hydrolase [Nocardia sp. NPDC088792]|uniref:alpha/beta hydrolase n=1 Tax=Nocardia sp. NPDC088792 TaxID=3364332 RepID=UPI00380D496C